MSFDFKAATPSTTQLVAGNYLMGAASQSASTPTLYDAKTLPLISGNFTATFTITNNTAITLPTAGTMSILGANTYTDAQTLAAGTTSIVPIRFTSGTNLTTPLTGGMEYDGAQLYGTIDTTSGRGAVPIEQYNHLTAAGSSITTIANFFGSTSNISLVASAYYIIDIEMWYAVVTGTQTVTWTLTNSSAPTSQNIHYEMSPATGIVAPPGTATYLEGDVYNDTTAAKTVVTAALTAANHVARFHILLQNGSGTSLKIQATSSANSITPGINSYWRCRRMAPAGVGTFAA